MMAPAMLKTAASNAGDRPGRPPMENNGPPQPQPDGMGN
jgi:hypothetical protein